MFKNPRTVLAIYGHLNPDDFRLVSLGVHLIGETSKGYVRKVMNYTLIQYNSNLKWTLWRDITGNYFAEMKRWELKAWF